MRILSASVENFGSYEKLSFDFTNQGLTLISGPTGSGKSTLMDIVPWILFGITAKNGAVDEVRSWNQKETTKGVLVLELGSSRILIQRTRAPNDLLLHVLQSPDIYGGEYRGKDLNDTQGIINEKLGLTAETYLAGAYFHEFSQTAAFFTAPAKARRQITEQLVDLTQVKNMTELMTRYKKELKYELDEKTGELSILRTKKDMVNKSINTEEHRCLDWYDSINDRLANLRVQQERFEKDKIKAIDKVKEDHTERSAAFYVDIQDLEKELVADSSFEELEASLVTRKQALEGKKCLECGAPKDVDKLMIINKDLYKVEVDKRANEDKRRQLKVLSQRLEMHNRTLLTKLAVENGRRNTYGEQLTALKNETNPHESFKEQLYKDLKVLNKNEDVLQLAVEDLTQEIDDITLLLQVAQDLRGALLAQAVQFLEDQTNQMLNDHFDAEIKIKFDIADSDKLDVTILKDGNECSYSQLSKGQRQLLRLTFGVAVMKQVGNSSGVQFSTLFLDEVFDGLDEFLKLKGFTLLEQLATEYESIFAIDHNEAVKSMFINRYDVELVDGKSVITNG